jgi:hypothetical protein
LNNQPRPLPSELPSHSRRVLWAQRFFEIEAVARTERLQTGITTWQSSSRSCAGSTSAAVDFSQ